MTDHAAGHLGWVWEQSAIALTQRPSQWAPRMPTTQVHSLLALATPASGGTGAVGALCAVRRTGPPSSWRAAAPPRRRCLGRDPGEAPRQVCCTGANARCRRGPCPLACCILRCPAPAAVPTAPPPRAASPVQPPPPTAPPRRGPRCSAQPWRRHPPPSALRTP